VQAASSKHARRPVIVPATGFPGVLTAN